MLLVLLIVLNNDRIYVYKVVHTNLVEPAACAIKF